MGITSQNHLGLGITTISNIEHESYTIQTFPSNFIYWFARFAAVLEPELYYCLISRFVVHQIVLQCVFFLFFFAVCRAPSRAPMHFFFRGLSGTKSCSNARFFFSKVCRAPNRAPMRAFFSRFAEHQIVLQCVPFFAVCCAPNRAPMRVFFFSGLSCTKSCSTLWFLAWCVFWEIVAGGFSAMFAIFNLS